MKRLCLITFAALALVSCGGEDGVKLDDQNGFHQAVKFGGEHGTALKKAKSYEEFKASRATIEEYQAAFKDQLGGESYLAYLKCVSSAIDGIVLTEQNIDQDAEILFIRDFYQTNNEAETNKNGEHPAATMAKDYTAKLKAAKGKEEYDKIVAEIKVKAEEIFLSGDAAACEQFVDNLF